MFTEWRLPLRDCNIQTHVVFTVTDPNNRECVLAKKILETLEEGGKTSSSYYVSMQETVKACEKQELEPTDTEWSLIIFSLYSCYKPQKFH